MIPPPASLLLRNARVIDPASGADDARDLLILNGRIAPAGATPPPGVPTLDAAGRVACPGLIDIHVHLREPGRPDKETIESGSRAAARGGFTTIVAMPNTQPAADTAAVIAWMKERAARTAVVNVLFTGCISQGRKGELLAPIGSLMKAGVVAITDDGDCVQSAELMRRAFEYARMFHMPILDHCQDYSLTANGVINEGYWSMLLGLPGWPAIAEEIMIARNALLAELTNHHVHCQHVTTAGGVRIIREAKQRGIRISGEATPHHLTLTDAACQEYNTHFKMNPPLRTARDIDALIEGLDDGTLEVLATDHAPHCSYEKEVEFQEAPFGIVGLETAVGVLLDALHHRRAMPLPKILRKLTANPAKILNLPKGTLAPGADGDVTIIDPDLEWTVNAADFESLGRNTPWDGHRFRGRATATIIAGNVVWKL